MALTKIQIEHAKSRVNEAAQEYVRQQIAALGPEPDDDWSVDEKHNMICNGAAKPLPLKKFGMYGNVFDRFEYPEHLNAERASRWREQRDAIRAVAEAKAAEIIDRLILSPDGLSVLAYLKAAFPA